MDSQTNKFETAIELLTAGRPEAAAAACREVLAAEPRHPHALHMLGVIRADQGALQEGLELVERSLATGERHPAIYYAHGNLLMRAERFDEAIRAFRLSLALDPGELRAHRLLGVARIRRGLLADAEADLLMALRQQPDSAVLLNVLAEVRMAQGRYVEAEALLNEARRKDPGHADSLANLALVCEHNNRLDEARLAVDEGLRRWPDHPQLQIVLAKLERRAGDFKKAYAECEAMLARPQPTVMQRDLAYELGLCAEAMGDTERAYGHFSHANALALKIAKPPQAFVDEFPQHIDKLASAFNSDWVASWRPLTAPATLPAFLIGFPRSGTTLLDTMLGAHPDLAVLEERPAIQAMLDAAGSREPDYPAKLANLDAGMHAALQAAYSNAARQCGWDGQKHLLDKSPFATAHAGLIQRIFPGAPLLFVSRHPCDVVLSCFMNNFGINSGTVHFTRLEDTVSLYCKVMALWLQFRAVLPLRVHMVKYESLIQTPETELRAILDFLDLPWAAELGDHTAHALKRGRIPTPSYQQVSQPLYQTARDRWRRYEMHLHPFIPQLRPYIDVFGYEA